MNFSIIFFGNSIHKHKANLRCLKSSHDHQPCFFFFEAKGHFCIRKDSQNWMLCSLWLNMVTIRLFRVANMAISTNNQYSVLLFLGGWRQQLYSVCFLFWNLQQLYLRSSWWDSSGSYLCKVSGNIVGDHHVLLYHLSFNLNLVKIT